MDALKESACATTAVLRAKDACMCMLYLQRRCLPDSPPPQRAGSCSRPEHAHVQLPVWKICMKSAERGLCRIHSDIRTYVLATAMLQAMLSDDYKIKQYSQCSHLARAYCISRGSA